MSLRNISCSQNMKKGKRIKKIKHSWKHFLIPPIIDENGVTICSVCGYKKNIKYLISYA